MKIILYMFLILVIAISCNSEENSNEKKITETNNHTNKLEEDYLDKVQSFLPSNIALDEFILVYRFGSVQWTPYSSVLCIPKTETTAWSYVQFNVGMESNFVPSSTTPKMSLFQFKMENTLPDFTNLPLLSSKKIEFSGEGYCFNLFVVQSNGKRYVLNSGDSESLEFFQKIYQRISQLEHIQSLSLSNNCRDLDSLARSIRESNIDNYLLKFDRNINLW